VLNIERKIFLNQGSGLGVNDHNWGIYPLGRGEVGFAMEGGAGAYKIYH
jgi:hypothetical protein